MVVGHRKRRQWSSDMMEWISLWNPQKITAGAIISLTKLKNHLRTSTLDPTKWSILFICWGHLMSDECLLAQPPTSTSTGKCVWAPAVWNSIPLLTLLFPLLASFKQNCLTVLASDSVIENLFAYLCMDWSSLIYLFSCSNIAITMDQSCNNHCNNRVHY